MHETLDNTFLTQQSAIMIRGSTQYKSVHTWKEKLWQEGKLPVSTLCDKLISAAHETLNTGM